MKVYDGASVTGSIDAAGDGDIGDGCQIHTNLHCGEGVHIAPNVTLVGKYPIELADGATIAPGVVIYTSRPNTDCSGRNKYRNGHDPVGGKVTLGVDVFVGSNSVVGQGTTLAEGVAIGANSYVERDITEPWTFWAGSPVEKIREISRE